MIPKLNLTSQARVIAAITAVSSIVVIWALIGANERLKSEGHPSNAGTAAAIGVFWVLMEIVFVYQVNCLTVGGCNTYAWSQVIVGICATVITTLGIVQGTNIILATSSNSDSS